MVYPLNAPLMELLLLSIIGKEDSYGYMIGQRLKTVSNLKDSTLYPILKRLSDEAYVEIYDQQFQGRNRKYYRITEAGRERRDELQREWLSFTKEIGSIMEQDINEGGTLSE